MLTLQKKFFLKRGYLRMHKYTLSLLVIIFTLLYIYTVKLENTNYKQK